MKIVLKAGLVLRHGQRTLELVRVLDKGQVQLEDTLTRRPSVISEGKLLGKIWSGEWSVVAGNVAVDVSGTAARDGQRDTCLLMDVSSFPESWRRQIEYRLRYIKGLQAAHVSRGQRARVTSALKAVAAAINDKKPPSASAVMAWARRYQTSDCNPVALLNLSVLNRRPRRLHCLVEQVVADTLRTEYFSRSRHSLGHAHDCIKRELKQKVHNGELDERSAVVSLATVARRVGDVDLYHRIASREGDARARMVCRTTMDGAAASYPLQRVEVDHTPLNWVVICDVTGLPLGRAMLTVAADAFSAYILGIYVTFYGPGVTSVTGVLRNAAIPKDSVIEGLGLRHAWLSHGLGDEWVLDNGLEFHSNAFKSMCWTLGIDITYCRVRTPWLKPHVERFFGELDYLTLARGRVHKRVANVFNVDPYRDACITFSDLVKGLTMFVVDVHPFHVNQRKLARPFDLFSEGLQKCPPAAYPGSWDDLRLVSGMSKQLTVGPGGVELAGLPFGGPELLPMRKRYGQTFKALCKWDPDEISSIYVQAPRDPKWWVQSPCRWEEYAAGLSWNQHRLIRKFARQELAAKDAEAVLWESRMRLHDHWQDATRRKTSADAVLAGRYAGLTSSRVLQGGSLAAPAPRSSAPAVVISQPAEPLVIPEFDAFELEGNP